MRVVIGACAFALAGQISAAHQPGCVLVSNVNALALQHAPHFPHPVNAAIFSMNVANMLHDRCVATTAGVYTVGFGLAVPTRSKKAAFAMRV